MAEQNDSAEKPHEPTPRKLEEARRKGEVPKSNDLVTAASLGGLALAGLAVGGGGLIAAGTLGTVLLDQADRLAPQVLGGASGPIGGILVKLAMALGPLFLVPVIAALVSLVAQQALVFAPEKLKPKLSRISPIANAKQKFGPSGLFEFGKNTVKLLVISAVLFAFLMGRLPQILMTMHLGPSIAVAELMRLVLEFLALVVGILFLIGAVDYLWQRHRHFQKHRMSHKELRDEIKQSEGDPQMKQTRRERGQEIATNRMLLEVPKADVVIVNPSHYAVALRWNRLTDPAPVCVAKGVDEIAARIRESAATAGVPVRRDQPTARALYATVEIGAPIRPEHYRAVAAAIRFAEKMRSRAARRRPA